MGEKEPMSGLDARLWSMAEAALAGESPERRQRKLDLLAPTPEAFLKLAYFLGCDRMYMSPVYRKLYSLLVSDYPRILILLPRATYKSTALEVSVVRNVLLNRNCRELYSSQTKEQAWEYTGWILRQFEENVELIDLFGEFRPPGRTKGWSKSEMRVLGRTDLSKKEATITAKGLLQVRAGPHYSRIVIDDPCSMANTGTRTAIETTNSAFKHIFAIAEEDVDIKTGKIKSRTPICVSCTRYDDGDMLGYILSMNEELLKRRKAGDETIIPWKILEVPAVDGRGRPNFKHLPFDVLEQKKIEMTLPVYNAQMLLDPAPAGTAHFKREWFKLIPSHEIPKPEVVYNYMLTDTATSKDRGDDTALFVISRDAAGYDYVRDAAVGQFGPMEVMEHLFSLYLKWGCRGVLMEKIAINEIYGEMIELRMRERQQRIHIQPVFGRTRERKEDRIDSLQAPLSTGKLLFSSDLPRDLIHYVPATRLCHGKLVEEFVRFPHAKHDDIPDALSDLNKKDPRGMALCPRPKVRQVAAPQRPGILNGKFVNVPPASQAQQGGNLWGKLKKQVRGGR